MRLLTQQPWLALAFLISILTILSNAYPSRPNPLQRTSAKRNVKHNLLLARNDDPFLGEEWDIITMENHAAYLPHQAAARDLAAFYISLQATALFTPVNPENYFVYRINRVLLTFHSRGIYIPMSLILRFATGMLEFTRRGYTSAYRMRFRHSVFRYVLEVTLTVDDDPPPPPGPGQPECTAVVPEEHGEVNQSGIRQTCILRPPSFPQ
ncbi:MAG: hypothetical protein Q9216_005717 [Gyalolechia sp. 2 TL-2023]